MRSVLFLLLLFLFGKQELLISQEMNGNLTKYWFYRWRLRNDFMVMGEGPGKSLVIQDRNPERKDIIRFADATIMQGYYLSMLAIEHRILTELGRIEDLKNNERELYYALKAVERLDFVAETNYSDAVTGSNSVGYRSTDNPQRPCRNGFFFRDDVPPTFINYTPSFGSSNNFTENWFKLNNNKTGINYGLMNYNKGDYEGLWASYDPNPSDNENGYLTRPFLDQPHHPIVNYENGRDNGDFSIGEESQDQLIRLILGFEMIVKSIPNQVFEIDKNNDGLTDEYYNFYVEAQRNFTNMVGRLNGYTTGTNLMLCNNIHLNPYPGLFNPPFPWKIYNPRYDKTFGGYIGPFKPPIQLLTPMLFTSNNDLYLSHYSQILGLSSGVFNTSWLTGAGAGYNDFVVAKMALIMNCASNSGNENGLKTVPRSIFIESKDDDERQLHGFFVPLYDYLWGWNPDDSKRGKKDQGYKDESYNLANIWLNNAPCVGPHNFAYSYWMPGSNNPLGPFSTDQFINTGAPPYWNTPFLFDSEFSRFDDGIAHDGNVAEGWFSGVDYMLLYNLIYANADYERPMYHDLINRIVDYDINTDINSELIEYSGTGLLIGAFENLKIRNKIYGNQNVEIKSLDYVLLEPGSEVDPMNSGNILIYTDKITCTSGNFTGVTDPFQINTCSTCNLENNIASGLAPIVSKRILSLEPEVIPLSMEELVVLEENNLNIEESNTVIFPNPVVSSFQVNSSIEYEGIVISDGSGKVIVEFTSSREYDISNLQSGIYLITIINSSYESKVYKIIKL